MEQIKNKLTKCIMLMTIAFFGQSCEEFLDVAPEDVAQIEDAFESRLLANRFLTTLYSRIPNVIAGGENPAEGVISPELAGGDEIWFNDERNRDAQNNIFDFTRLIGGGQNTFSPLYSFWGNNSPGGDVNLTNLYIAIRDCNIFLNNLDRPFDLEEDERIRWEAEAKVLKAYFHFFLMRMYGPVPIIDDEVDITGSVEDTRNIFRSSIDDVVNYTVGLLDEAIPNLPVFVGEINEFGRISGATAAAIKAQVLVTAASPLFNGGAEGPRLIDQSGRNLIPSTPDEQKWTRAAEACREAMELAEAAGHTLYQFPTNPDWSDTTNIKLGIRGSVTEPWNSELIWGDPRVSTVALMRASRPTIDPAITPTGRVLVNGFWAPTMRVAEQFYSANGVPIDEDVDYDYANRFDLAPPAGPEHANYVETGYVTARLNLNREPRFYASLGFDGGIWFGGGVTDEDRAFHVEAKRNDYSFLNGPGGAFSATGYYAKKLEHYLNVHTNGGYQGSADLNRYPFPLIRLADVYLMYAEALNESGNSALAIDFVDRIRARAGLGGVIQSWADHSNNPGKPSTQAGLRDIIRQERLIELALEGKRYWDLRRWLMTEEFMNREIMGWNISGDDDEEYYRTTVITVPSFRQRDYLWPIADTDILGNPNLIQNPGW